MAYLSHKKKEIRAKIVYYGPGLSGKTSNVEYIFNKMRSDHRGDLLNLSTRERTIFFDFLPVELGNIKGYKTSFHIFTVPGQVFYNETRKAVLNDVDGVVFVADSRKKMRDENLRSLKNLEENLTAYSKKLSDVPHVFQYNKRDMPDIMSVEELHLLLNKTGAPFFEAVATDGTGVLNTLKLISKMVLKKLSSAGGAIKELEGDFEDDNYGLSPEYVALNPGETASASVKVVTAMKIESKVEDTSPEPEPEAPPPTPERVVKPATREHAGDESYEARIGDEPVDESEIPEPPGTAVESASPEPESEEPGPKIIKTVDDMVTAHSNAVKASKAAPATEKKAESAQQNSGWEMKEPLAENQAPQSQEQPQAASPPQQETPQPPQPPPQPAQPAYGKQIELYQWGFPERLNINTIRIPIFFKDQENGQEFWSYLTISLEHIYKRQ